MQAPWADEQAMRWALRLAPTALASGDVPIAALVLNPEGRVIAEAVNRREADGNPVGHAEVLALQQAALVHRDGWRLTDCTLVVTLEPCTMCAGAAVLSRIGRIVYGAPDDKAGAVGGLWDVVRDPRLPHRPEVIAGVLASESAHVLRTFFHRLRSETSTTASPAVTQPIETVAG